MSHAFSRACLYGASGSPALVDTRVSPAQQLQLHLSARGLGSGPVVVVACAPPSSGKSTMALQWQALGKGFCVTDEPADLRALLEKGMRVFVDQCNSSVKQRMPFLDVAAAARGGEGVPGIFMLFDIKRELLAELLKRPEVKRTIVFTRTKRGADKVTEYLATVGLSAVAIHGNKSQGQRERALETFRAGRTPVLVATDIAARGIDVDGVTHVVNYELPDVAESYVHRIGRTARAGADGAAFTLCDDAERHLLRAIEKLTRQSIPATDRRQPGARPLSEPPRAAAPGGRGGKPQGRPGAGKPAHTGPRPGQAARNGASRPRPAREAGGFSR
jgi:hypothetical protein